MAVAFEIEVLYGVQYCTVPIPLGSRACCHSLKTVQRIRPKQVALGLLLEITKIMHCQWIAISGLVTVAWRRFKNENTSEAHDKHTEPLFRDRKTCSGRWNQGVWFLTAKIPKRKKRGQSLSQTRGNQVCYARPKYSMQGTVLYTIVLYTVLYCTDQ